MKDKEIYDLCARFITQYKEFICKEKSFEIII